MIVGILRPVNPASAIDTSAHVYLGCAPFPGDIILTAANQKVRIIRRVFVDHGSEQAAKDPRYADLELYVRMEDDVDG